MSLSRRLQSKDILSSLAGKKPDEVREALLRRGREWYAAHEHEQALIKENLHRFGLPAGGDLIERIQTNVILHYYEKILPLTGDAAFYRQFLSDNVETVEAERILTDAKNSGAGVLIATAHFGAVELIVPCCALLGFAANVMLRFTTPEFSAAARAHAKGLADSGLFAPINFIEIGKPGTMAALEMAAALRRREMLVSVFDEQTDYSVPATLFEARVWGGAGLDKLIRFAGTPIVLVAAFMMRAGNGRYRLVLTPIPIDTGDPIQALYTNLQALLAEHLDQWYFLHEEVPFVNQ
jgi:lauroyl/myristoyl acyltransferase